MKKTLLGALKAVVPFAVAALLVGVDALFGKPVDLEYLHVLVVGAITSFFVYLIPNLTLPKR